jgi:hypothetical protein
MLTVLLFLYRYISVIDFSVFRVIGSHLGVCRWKSMKVVVNCVEHKKEFPSMTKHLELARRE